MIFKEQTFNECLDNLHNINAILFFQQNFGLSIELSDQIKHNFAYDEIIIIDFQDVEKNFSSILQGYLCDSFFASKKIIKVFNFKPNGKSKLKEELEFLNKKKFKDKIVLFFAQDLDSKSAFKTFFEKGDFTASIACYLDDEKKAFQCIQDFFSKKKININQQACDEMAKMLHGDRKNLFNECEKLALYTINNNEITTNDVEDVIVDNQESDLSVFADNVLAGNIKKAFYELELLKKDDISIVSIARFMIQSAEQILSMKEMIKEGTSIEDAMKSKFIFWKRAKLVKIAITKTTVRKLEKYISISLKTEKNAKIYTEDVAFNYFKHALFQTIYNK